MNSNIGPWNDFELVLPKGIRCKDKKAVLEETKLPEMTKQLENLSLGSTRVEKESKNE